MFTMDTQKARKIEEMKVLQQELKTLKKGAAVYKQQQNSSIFFKADREKVFQESKRNLDDLIEEYKQAEQLDKLEVDPDG